MKRSLLFVFAGLFLWTGLGHGQTVLSAQDAVAYALSHRPEVRAANDRVTASERLRSQAGLIPNPRFLFRKEDFTDHLNVGEHPETQAKLGSQNPVEFDGDEALRALGEQGSEDSSSGADFEHSVLRNIAEGVDDLQGKTVIGEEMLSQFRLVLGTASGDDLRHVDPLFLGL